MVFKLKTSKRTMEIFKLIGSVMVDTADAQKSISKTSDCKRGGNGGRIPKTGRALGVGRYG